jgi:hypothetical protein
VSPPRRPCGISAVSVIARYALRRRVRSEPGCRLSPPFRLIETIAGEAAFSRTRALPQCRLVVCRRAPGVH